MSYQIEISKKELLNSLLALAIVPCLLFSAGFLTASFSHDRADALPPPTASAATETTPAPMQPEQAPVDAPMISDAAQEPPALEPAPTAPAVAAAPVPETPLAEDQQFSVQTAAFQSASNAINFAAQLKAKGYPAEVTVKLRVSEAPIYKVVYGSFAHEEAIRSAIAFTQQERIPAFVIARS